MSTNLDKICTVDISLGTPVSNDANFDTVLILGPAPTAPSGDVPRVGVYRSLEQLTSLGVKATGDDADPIGLAARVAFYQSPRPHDVYVAYTGQSQDLEEDLDVDAVLEQALAMNGWYCICPVGLEDNDVKKVIEWAETQSKLCGYIEDDPKNPVVKTGLYMRSFAVYAKVSESDEDAPDENKYGIAVAMAVKAMNHHAGAETWALKNLSIISPSKLTPTFISDLTTANVSYAISVGDKTITQGGKTNGGEWIDVIRFRDWQQSDIQSRIVNLLVQNPKVPYTDAGIGLVENQLIASLSEGQRWGGIAPTEYDEDGEANPGFTTNVPLSADVPASDKASRKLTGISFSARLAGAIHVVEINGCLTYDSLV